jgi:hypothetical protein
MSQIPSYTPLTSTQPDDLLPIVDVHDSTMSSVGTTKKITVANLLATVSQGLSVKLSVQEATAAALPPNTYAAGVLTATANGALTVDGVAVSAGDRVLVQDEAAAANNGIYTVTATGGAGAAYVLTRAADMTSGSQFPGAFTFVEQGTVNASAGFVIASEGPFTVGTTAVTWTQFSGAGEIQAGSNLVKAGNTISVASSPALAGTPTAPTPAGSDNSTRIATTAFVATALAGAGQGLTQTAVQTANYTATAGQLVLCDISGGSFTALLPNAPAAGTLFAAGIVAVSGVGVNALTIQAQGSDVLDKSGGATSGTMTLLHQLVVYEYNSGVWAKSGSADPYLQVAQNRQGTYYLDQYAGTDDQKMTAALAAWSAAGTGKIVLSPRAHTFTGQWATTYSAGVAQGLIIEGAGIAYNGMWGNPSAATTCDMQYASTGAARMDFQHLGSIEIRGIEFKDTVASTVPFFQTTNATPNIHDNIFAGNSSVTGVACYQDAIVLGGTGSVYGAGDTAPYQGYQGDIYRNFFHRIRRIALFQTSSNSIEIHSNTISTSCGNGAYLGGCIEFNDTVNNTTGNHVWGNCVEMVNYPCFIRCTSGAVLNTFGPNGLYDATLGSTSAYHAFLGAGNSYNNVIDGFRADTVPLILDLSGNVGNEAVTSHQSQVSLHAQPSAFYSASTSTVFMGSPGGPVTMDANGNGAQIAALLDVPSANDSAVQIQARCCTQVTDGIIYSGSPVVASITAAFATTDVYRTISYTGVAASTPIIVRTVTPSTAIRWVASTAYNLGDVTRPVTANSHLYQCTTAGTTGSSQPTWPTSAGTVTDGTAVWTDLGTSATAAYVSAPSTATNTGVTVNFGRFQATQSFTTFKRHHILTSDGGTPSTGADAAAGTSPSGVSTTGSDHSFTVNITSGTSPASGQMFHSNMAQNAGTFHVIMNAGNAAAAALMAGGYWVVVVSNSVQVNFVNAPAASTAYIFNFVGMC